MEIARGYLRSRKKICIIIFLGTRVNTERKNNAPMQDNKRIKKKKEKKLRHWFGKIPLKRAFTNMY